MKNITHLIPLIAALLMACSAPAYRTLEHAQELTSGYYVQAELDGAGIVASNLMGAGFSAGARGTISVIHARPGSEPATLFSSAIGGMAAQGVRLALVTDENGADGLELRRIGCDETVSRWPTLGPCPESILPASGTKKAVEVIWRRDLPPKD